MTLRYALFEKFIYPVILAGSKICHFVKGAAQTAPIVMGKIITRLSGLVPPANTSSSAHGFIPPFMHCSLREQPDNAKVPSRL